VGPLSSFCRLYMYRFTRDMSHLGRRMRAGHRPCTHNLNIFSPSDGRRYMGLEQTRWRYQRRSSWQALYHARRRIAHPGGHDGG